MTEDYVSELQRLTGIIYVTENPYDSHIFLIFLVHLLTYLTHIYSLQSLSVCLRLPPFPFVGLTAPKMAPTHIEILLAKGQQESFFS